MKKIFLWLLIGNVFNLFGAAKEDAASASSTEAEFDLSALASAIQPFYPTPSTTIPERFVADDSDPIGASFLGIELKSVPFDPKTQKDRTLRHVLAESIARERSAEGTRADAELIRDYATSGNVAALSDILKEPFGKDALKKFPDIISYPLFIKIIDKNFFSEWDTLAQKQDKGAQQLITEIFKIYNSSIENPAILTGLLNQCFLNDNETSFRALLNAGVSPFQRCLIKTVVPIYSVESFIIEKNTEEIMKNIPADQRIGTKYQTIINAYRTKF